MATLRNISQSALSVPAFNNRVVEPDELVETDNATAQGFAGQDQTWQVELDDEQPAEEPAEPRARGRRAPQPEQPPPPPGQTVVQNEDGE